MRHVTTIYRYDLWSKKIVLFAAKFLSISIVSAREKLIFIILTTETRQWRITKDLYLGFIESDRLIQKKENKCTSTIEWLWIESSMVDDRYQKLIFNPNDSSNSNEIFRWMSFSSIVSRLTNRPRFRFEEKQKSLVDFVRYSNWSIHSIEQFSNVMPAVARDKFIKTIPTPTRFSLPIGFYSFAFFFLDHF